MAFASLYGPGSKGPEVVGNPGRSRDATGPEAPCMFQPGKAKPVRLADRERPTPPSLPSGRSVFDVVFWAAGGKNQFVLWLTSAVGICWFGTLYKDSGVVGWGLGASAGLCSFPVATRCFVASSLVLTFTQSAGTKLSWWYLWPRIVLCGWHVENNTLR